MLELKELVKQLEFTPGLGSYGPTNQLIAASPEPIRSRLYFFISYPVIVVDGMVGTRLPTCARTYTKLTNC